MSLEVKVEDVNISEIIEKSDLSSDNKKKVLKSGMILLPSAFSTSHNRGNFSSETPDFLKFIRAKHPEINVSLFENTGEEKVQGLHAADIIIPPILSLIQDISFQIMLAIVSTYLYEKLKGDPKKETKRIKTEFFYKESADGKIKHIIYEGPVKGLKDIEKIVNSDEKK
jgi:hypothetical protein